MPQVEEMWRFLGIDKRLRTQAFERMEGQRLTDALNLWARDATLRKRPGLVEEEAVTGWPLAIVPCDPDTEFCNRIIVDGNGPGDGGGGGGGGGWDGGGTGPPKPSEPEPPDPDPPDAPCGILAIILERQKAANIPEDEWVDLAGSYTFEQLQAITDTVAQNYWDNVPMDDLGTSPPARWNAGDKGVTAADEEELAEQLLNDCKYTLLDSVAWDTDDTTYLTGTERVYIGYFDSSFHLEGFSTRLAAYEVVKPLAEAAVDEVTAEGTTLGCSMRLQVEYEAEEDEGIDKRYMRVACTAHTGKWTVSNLYNEIGCRVIIYGQGVAPPGGDPATWDMWYDQGAGYYPDGIVPILEGSWALLYEEEDMNEPADLVTGRIFDADDLAPDSWLGPVAISHEGSSMFVRQWTGWAVDNLIILIEWDFACTSLEE